MHWTKLRKRKFQCKECSDARHPSNLWICLHYASEGNIGTMIRCGRTVNKHSAFHVVEERYPLSINMQSLRIQ